MSQATGPHVEPPMDSPTTAPSAHGHGDPHAEAPLPRVCQNCAAALTGPYCGFCGQRALRLDVSLRELLHEGVHEFIHLDGRILATLRLLLTRPGRLTAEMLAGRRQRYIAPIRLYLVCSLLFFVTLTSLVSLPKAGPDDVANVPSVKEKPARSTFQWSPEQGARIALKNPERFLNGLWNLAPKVAFVLVPGFALLTMAAFRRRVRFFVPHLYFALHFHSCVFLVLIPVLMIETWTWYEPSFWMFALAPGYLVLATREAFEAKWWEATWKSVLVSSVYGAVVAAAVLGLVLLSLSRI